MSWEYLVEEEPAEERLNELGANGWELVSVAARGSVVVSYFKRPVADLRQRVTLDHRQRFVAAAGNQTGSEA
ncbi:MAG: hypothetical protein M3509_09850 [Chloroflexota bacterium]|nr:hypothetical protein [Chloroflexota bacterium]